MPGNDNKKKTKGSGRDKDLQDLVDYAQRRRDYEQEINDLLDTRTITQRDLIEIQEERASIGEALVGSYRDQLAHETELLALSMQNQQNEKAIEETRIRQAQEKISLIESEYETGQKISAEDQKQIKAQAKLIEGADENIKKAEKELYILKGQVAHMGKKTMLQDAMTQGMGSFAVKLGLSAKTSDSLLGKFVNISQNMRNMVKRAGGWKQGLKAVGGSLLEVFSITNLISSAMTAMFKASLEFVFAFSKAVAEVSAATGTAGEMAGVAAAGMDLSAGVDIAESASALVGLAGSYTKLTSMSESAAGATVKLGGQLERLGVGAATTGKNLTFLTQAMGKTDKESRHTLRGLAAAASTMGKTVGQFSEEFAAASSSLSSHGDGMEDVFMKLQAQSKITGLAFKDLQSMAEKFDTFESAASAVGSLNAILGGDYLNSIEMMNMTENERIETVKRAINAQGIQFNQMERFQRKALAKQLGYDTAQLAQLLGSQTEEEMAAADAAKAKADQEAKYQKMLTSTVDILRSFQIMLAEFFRDKEVMKAITEGIKEFFNTIGEHKDEIAEFMKGLGKTLAWILKGLIALSPAALVIGGVLMLLISPLMIIGKTIMWIGSLIPGVSGWFTRRFGSAAAKNAQKIADAAAETAKADKLAAKAAKAKAARMTAMNKTAVRIPKGTPSFRLKSSPDVLRKAGQPLPQKGAGGKEAAELAKKMGWKTQQQLARASSAWNPKNWPGVKQIRNFQWNKLVPSPSKWKWVQGIKAFFSSRGFVGGLVAGVTGGLKFALRALINWPVAFFGGAFNAANMAKSTDTIGTKVSAILVGVVKALTLGDLWEDTWFGKMLFGSKGFAGVAEFWGEWFDALADMTPDWIGVMLKHLGFETAIDAFLKLGEWMNDFMTGQIFDNIANFWNSTFTGFFSIPYWQEVFDDWTRGLYWMGVDAIDGFLEPFSDLSKRVGAFFSETVQDVKDVLGISSPSDVLYELGLFAMEGFTDALAWGMENVLRPIMDLVGAFFDKVTAAGAAFKVIGAEIASIGLAIAKISMGKVIQLSRGIEVVMRAASEVKSPGGAVRVIEAATTYQKEKQKADAKNQAQIPDELVTLMKQGQGSGGAGNGQVEVVLRLKDGLQDFVEQTTINQFNYSG